MTVGSALGRFAEAGRSRADWLPSDSVPGALLRGLRWGAVTSFVVVLVTVWHRDGVPFDRTTLLAWLAAGLAATCIGRRPVRLVLVVADFVPLAAVLIAYDYLRGLSDKVGLPTWWHPQAGVDRFLFAGHEPTVWLQEHLKYVHPDFTTGRYVDVRWYDVLVCLCYTSFFFLPYVTAAVLWLRGRVDFYRWSLRFVALSFLGFAIFLLAPTAPPWAAARCSAAQVAGHPSNPSCINDYDASKGGILGRFTSHRPGANAFVERISSAGYSRLHIHAAQALLEQGRATVDLVAAVPSLHLGGTVLFALFMWGRVRRWWRPVLVAYPLVMTFSLAYSGEHYVSDCIAGALAAVLVHAIACRVERRGTRRRAADTLDRCPPTDPPPLSSSAATPSSTSASVEVSSSPPARSTAAPARPGTTARSASS